jgi:N-acetylglutamate synthase-like GNAT family acetyltransferase
VIEIVPFSHEYGEGVVSVVLPIQQSEFGVPITLEQQPDLTSISDFYQRGAGNFWVALHEREVVGTLGLVDIGERQVALRKMFVKAPFRGHTHGVAVRLLQAALDWGGTKQLREVYLGTTSKYLAAHRFYEKNGFAEIPVERLPAAFPRMAVDTKFYWRAFAG